jgi:uncharacterized protein (DUF58 family)
LRNIFNAVTKRDPGSTSATGPALTLPPQAFLQLDHLQLNAGRSLPGNREGLRPSLRRRPSSDFLEHRPYTAGDDVRFVDWKASARQEHIYIKQGEHPKEATVSILIDCSASMGWGSPPKSAAAEALAMALAYLALAHGDRLVLEPYGKTSALPLGPLSGKGQFPGMLNYLRGLEFAGAANLEAAALKFRREKALDGGMLFILSDFLGEENLETVLDHFPAPLWQVVLFQLLHPDELQPGALGNIELRDSETQQTANYDISPRAVKAYQENLAAWQASLDLTCVSHHALFSPIPTNWTLEKEVLSHLQDIHVVKPL